MFTSLAIGLLLATAALFDWRHRRIPNALTFGLALSGVLYGAATGGLGGARHSILGLLTGLALLMPLYLAGATGAGDVKLCAGIGAWYGAHQTIWILAYAAIAGGIFAVLWLTARCLTTGSLEPWRRFGYRFVAIFAMPRVSRADLAAKTGRTTWSLPYAIPIALGFWIWVILCWTAGHPA